MKICEIYSYNSRNTIDVLVLNSTLELKLNFIYNFL